MLKGVGITILVGLGLGVLAVGGWALSWFGEAATVAREEFGPRELLRKYSAFKDAHASLAAQKGKIDILQAAAEQLLQDYEGVPRKDWPRDDRQQLAQDRAAASGMKLIFNGAAAQYNADMAKFQYRFCNVGTLPEGATEPLPREYVTYLVK
jgi:hypothetical protein